MPESTSSLGRLARLVAVYGLGVLIQRAASFVLLPVYTRALTPADYGVLQLLQISLDLVAIAVSAGTTAGVLRFFFREDDEAERGRVLVTALALLVAFHALTAALLAAFARPIAGLVVGDESAAHLVRIVAAGFLFEPGSTVSLLWLQARERAALYTLVSSLRLALQIGLNVLLLVVLGWGVAGVVTSTAITNAVFGIGLSALLVWRTGARTSRRWARELLAFGLPYRLTLAGAFVLTFADRYFLKASRDLTEVGLYGLAYQFGFLLIYASSSPFMQAWAPQRFALAREPREVRDAANAEGFRWYCLAIAVVATGLCLFARPLLVVMSDAEFHSAAGLVPVVVVTYVLQAVTDALEFGIQVAERTRYTTYATWCAVAVVLVLYVTLIPSYGALGAALATLGAFAVRLGCIFYWSRRLWPIAYDWARPLRLFGFATTVSILALALRPDGIVGQIAVGAGAVAALAMFAWTSVLTRGDRSALARFRAGVA